MPEDIQEALAETIAEMAPRLSAEAEPDPEPQAEPEPGDGDGDAVEGRDSSGDDLRETMREAGIEVKGDEPDEALDLDGPLDDGELDPLSDPAVALLGAEARHRMATDQEYAQQMHAHIDGFAAKTPDFGAIRHAMGRAMMGALAQGRLMTLPEAAHAARQQVRRQGARKPATPVDHDSSTRADLRASYRAVKRKMKV